MSFKDLAFESRLNSMGDEAEGMFEQVYPHGWARYGLNRPRIAMSKLPLKIRYTPDYVTSAKLVECQGFGADQLVKVKFEKLVALHMWNSDMPTEIFLWDTTNQRFTYVNIATLSNTLHTHADLATFPEGKRYWALGADQLECEWQTVPPTG